MSLINAENVDIAVTDIWNKTGFIQKLERISNNIAFWDQSGKFSKEGFITFNNFHDLINFAKLKKNLIIFYLLANQYFLDEKIVKNGLKKMRYYNAEYFTQWEHARLPIGIGIRALLLNSLSLMNVHTPDEAIEYIKRHPQTFRILYEDHKYVSYEHSRINCLFSAKYFHETVSTACTYDLNGLLPFFYKKEIPEEKNNNKLLMRDERTLSCAFGFETKECAEFPTYIMFDITNVCNSKCIHCPHSAVFPQSYANPAFLEVKVFKKVIDECASKSIQFVRITADGEPLLHKGLFDMLDYAAKKKVSPVGLTTNGSLLTPEAAKRLLDTGLFMIDFSLDAIKESTYKKVRCGLSYKKVMNNIMHLLELKRKKSSSLKIMVSFVEQKENKNEAEEFMRYWKPLVDKVLIRKITSNVNLVDISESKENKAVKRWPCPHWFRRIIINYNGMIKACPIDWENKTIYKTLDQTTISDAWHSDFFWKNRMEHLNNRFSDESLCNNCNDWQGSPWNLGYEKVIGSL